MFNTSVRTWFIVHLILPRIHLQQGTIKLRISERLKLKDDDVPAILDTTVILQHISVSKCEFLLRDHYCFVCYYRSLDMYYLCIHLWRLYAVKHKQLLANHSSGRLLPSLQSATTPIQTERSDEGGQNRTEYSLLLLNYDVFYVKILIKI